MKNFKDIGSIVEWIGQMADVVANHGLWKIIKGIVALAFALIMLNVALNPGVMFEKFTQYTEKKEKENVEYRRSIDPIVRGELKELIYATNASRACVMEFHNGTSNFSSLGFLYAAMTYEEVRENVKSVSRLYSEISLSLFNISDIMYKNGYWYGTIDELSQVDKGLAERITDNGTIWMAGLLLEGSHELGFLLLSFDHVPEDPRSVGREIRRIGVSIASKLDYSNK